jgi:ZIP family zinc transporter
MGSVSSNVILGLIAGATIYIGLVVARWRRMPEGLQPFLALLSAGILIFLSIEVGYHSFESVETAFKLHHAASGFGSLMLVALGLVLGLIALGLWEDRRSVGKSHGIPPLELAFMTAVGIGVHNFGEGLAIGQSYASGAAALGMSLVIGFALHNATEGFGIVGAMRGERAGWGRIGLLGLIGGGPTVFGSIVGGFWTSEYLVTFCYALAAGSLLYVVREILRIPFRVPARVSLSAVACGLLLGLITETVVESAQAVPATSNPNTQTVEVRIAGGKFEPANLQIPSGANLRIVNSDRKVYTLEGATILRGDVPVDAGGSQTVRPTSEPGEYMIYAEEDAKMLLPVKVIGAGVTIAAMPGNFETSLKAGMQPVLFAEPADPSYGCFTSFNLKVKGEEARQQLLKDLFEIERSVMSEKLPPELDQYFSRSGWAKLRSSVNMIFGLGLGAYDPRRFGARVAGAKPADLHKVWYSKMLHFDSDKTQHDVIVRAASDSMWFNQQVCRYIWRKLKGRISDDRTLDSGYSNPNGRSPILGGFFDGTGNPIGKERDEAIFGKGKRAGGTYLAWFKIQFDEDKFASRSLSEQQAEIGRDKKIGKILPGSDARAHQKMAEGDSTRTILRQPFVYDEGQGKQGLLFASLQSNLSNQFEGILCGFMLNASKPKHGTGTDRLMDYMHFQEGGYYYIPPAPAGGYPGML